MSKQIDSMNAETTYKDLYTTIIKPIEDEIYIKTIEPIEDEIQKVKLEIDVIKVAVKSMEDEMRKMMNVINWKKSEIRNLEWKMTRPLRKKLNTAKGNKLPLLYKKLKKATKDKHITIQTEKGAIDAFTSWWRLTYTTHNEGNSVFSLDLRECISKEFKDSVDYYSYEHDPIKLSLDVRFPCYNSNGLDIPLKVKLAMKTLKLHINHCIDGQFGARSFSRII